MRPARRADIAWRRDPSVRIRAFSPRRIGAGDLSPPGLSPPAYRRPFAGRLVYRRRTNRPCTRCGPVPGAPPGSMRLTLLLRSMTPRWPRARPCRAESRRCRSASRCRCRRCRRRNRRGRFDRIADHDVALRVDSADLGLRERLPVAAAGALPLPARRLPAPRASPAAGPAGATPGRPRSQPS